MGNEKVERVRGNTNRTGDRKNRPRWRVKKRSESRVEKRERGSDKGGKH